MTRDKEKQRLYGKKWREENKERKRNLNKVWNSNNREKCKTYHKNWTEKNREWFNIFKQTLKCISCDETRWYCLDFHHRDPNEKELSIARSIGHWGKKRILEEASKCDVLCRNCHAAFHWEEKQTKGER